MKHAKTLWSLLPAVAVAAAVLATSAHARDLRHAIGYPPNSIGSDAADRYAEALEAFSATNNMNKSGQDLVDLYWNEVFSKVAVKTYGM